MNVPRENRHASAFSAVSIPTKSYELSAVYSGIDDDDENYTDLQVTVLFVDYIMLICWMHFEWGIYSKMIMLSGVNLLVGCGL